MRIKIFLPDSLLIFFFFFRTDLFYLCLNDCFIALRLRQYCTECLKVKNVKESEKQCNCSCLQPRTDGTCPRDPASLPRLGNVAAAGSAGSIFCWFPVSAPSQCQGPLIHSLISCKVHPSWKWCL